MAAEQPLDVDFQRISTEARSGLSFRRVDLGDKELIVDVSNGLPRPFVPLSMRKIVFDAIHGLGHPGTHRTAQIASSKFVWPNIKADCTNWAKQCIPCQRSKVTRHTTPEIGHFQVPSRRFSHLHVDIVTLSPSNGYSHLFTIVDRFTRWPVAIPIRDMSSESILDAFAHGWIAQYGIPAAVTSDRGAQFSGALWDQLLKHWGIKLLLTTAYHPEANGLVERLHRRLKESLLALCDRDAHLWYWRLPSALLSIRTTLKPDLGSSPADLVYGEGLAVPGDLHGDFPGDPPELLRQRQSAQANLRMEVARMQPVPTSAHRKPLVYIPPELADATHVFVRRGGIHPSFATPFEGPYRIVERSDAGYRILLPGGRQDVVALSRLKPAHVDVDDAVDNNIQRLDAARPPSPPRRGRPPRARPQTRPQIQPQNQPPLHSDGGTDLPVPRRSGRPPGARNRPKPPGDEAIPTSSSDASSAASRSLRPRRRPDLAEPVDPIEPSSSLSSSAVGPPVVSTLSTSAPDAASPRTVDRLKRLREEISVDNQLLHDDDDDDVSAQPSFFELGKLTMPSVRPPMSPSSSAIPSSLSSSPQQLMRGADFSARPRARPRPDVSAVLQHLGLASPSIASGPQQ